MEDRQRLDEIDVPAGEYALLPISFDRFAAVSKNVGGQIIAVLCVESRHR